MKWFLLLVVIGLALFTYNQQQRIVGLNNDLAKAGAQIEALQKRVQKPQTPFYERQSAPPAGGNVPPNQSAWGKGGNPLESSSQGIDGANRGGGKGRH